MPLTPHPTAAATIAISIAVAVAEGVFELLLGLIDLLFKFSAESLPVGDELRPVEVPTLDHHQDSLDLFSEIQSGVPVEAFCLVPLDVIKPISKPSKASLDLFSPLGRSPSCPNTNPRIAWPGVVLLHGGIVCPL